MSDKKDEEFSGFGDPHEAIFELVELIMDNKAAPFLFALISAIINLLLLGLVKAIVKGFGGSLEVLEVSFYTANLSYGIGAAIMTIFVVIAFLYPDEKITDREGFIPYILCILVGYGYINFAVAVIMMEILILYIVIQSIYYMTAGVQVWFSNLEEKIIE